MKKRILALILGVIMLTAIVGCEKKDNSSSVPSDTLSEVEEQASDYIINPLTGTADLKASAEKLRPTAIMINNIETAWGVQSSLSNADIVYETYVEGGITRLLAVFKDIRKVGKDKIGSLRSGRYSYVELALGHDARFVHAGLDDDYCRPHISSLGTTTVDLNTTATIGSVLGGNGCAERIPNGLSYEHTLYTHGNDIFKYLKENTDYKLSAPQENWQNFLEEGKEYVPAGGVCKELYVPFSGSYSAEFKFNEKTKSYDKYRYTTVQKDYANDNTVSFENVLVLYSTVTYFSDNKHVKTDLSSGSGYYVSNGGYSKIKWSKGDATSSLKITDENGNNIDYNAGKTYVCFTSTDCESGTTIK